MISHAADRDFALLISRFLRSLTIPPTDVVMTAQFRLALVLLALASPVKATACEPATSPPWNSFIGHHASITTSRGREHQCKVMNFSLVEMYWILSCTNGSKISIGIEDPGSDGSYTTYSILQDRIGQKFRMAEVISDEWRRYVCKNGVASRVFNIRLTQSAFFFDARVVENYRQRALPKSPVGF